jgi:hypothetical protein
VRFNQIGPEGGEALARAYIKSGYSEIDLSCNALGDSGADKIASVLSKNHGTILSLALPDNGITLKGDAFLAQKVPKRIRIFHRVEKVNFLNFVTSSPAKIFFAILFFPLLLFFLCKTYRVEKEGCIHQRTASS